MSPLYKNWAAVDNMPGTEWTALYGQDEAWEWILDLINAVACPNKQNPQGRTMLDFITASDMKLEDAMRPFNRMVEIGAVKRHPHYRGPGPSGTGGRQYVKDEVVILQAQGRNDLDVNDADDSRRAAQNAGEFDPRRGSGRNPLAAGDIDRLRPWEEVDKNAAWEAVNDLLVRSNYTGITKH